MSARLYYKDDSTFLRYLAMSYVGETAAISLMLRYGHQFQFDGDGAGSYDIFTEVARKKKRTPDLRCALCGQKLEVRSKGQIRIAMSDSPSRPFDRELAPENWVGFLQVSRIPSTSLDDLRSPADPANYVASQNMYVIKVSELSRSKPFAVRPPTKSSDKGSESYLEWPTLVARENGDIHRIERGPSFIEVKTHDGRLVRWIPPAGSYLYSGIGLGDPVLAQATLLTGVAKTIPMPDLICSGSSTSSDALKI
jgi:hypothetical protein